MKTRVANLTPRQREVVRLISLGCSDIEIGKILKLSPATVNNHRSAAMRTLGTDKAALIARLALRYRISSLKETLTAAEKRKSGRKRDGWN
ncbi:MAG: response regulator transcription factor [Planctomycetales bacterium]|nr:response regulator transcription factor [Planctomycetales bacterium]